MPTSVAANRARAFARTDTCQETLRRWYARLGVRTQVTRSHALGRPAGRARSDGAQSGPDVGETGAGGTAVGGVGGGPPAEAAGVTGYFEQSTVPAATSRITSRNAPYEALGVRSAQRTPDCQNSSSSWSRSRKLKKAPTYGWQYARRTASRSCVAWSGATLAAGGSSVHGAPATRSGRAADVSRPV